MFKYLYMPTHKSNNYKLTTVQYYLVEDKTLYFYTSFSWE